jgi:GntR family transcriptional regulator of vanillate catabolism
MENSLPHSGFTASEFSLSDIWDAIETRGILEGAAARLAAERLENSAQLEPLRQLRRGMQEILMTEPCNLIGYLDLNEAFHLAILDLANSKILRRAIDQVYKLPFAAPSSRMLLTRTLAMSKEIMPVGEEHHRALVDAIEHREGARAEGLAREHARLTRRHLEAALADQNFVETLPGARLVKVRAAGAD